MNESVCKNCGHDIAMYNDEWYHAGEEKDGDIFFSKECGFSLETEEARKFEEEKMEALDKEMKAEFGDSYGSWYWFFEIHCTCRIPEP